MKKGFTLKGKKILNISTIVVGILIVSVVGTKAATAIQSSMVTYNNTTVKETLDDLIDITVQGDASAEDITTGKTAIVKGKLVTGTKEEKVPLKLVFGENVNFTESHNGYVSSATVNNANGAVSWSGAVATNASGKGDSLYVQTSESFKLSDYKYFMHTISYTSNCSPPGTIKCYLKPKSGGSLIQLRETYITVGYTMSYYIDLSTVDYDKEEEYYLYFSCSTYQTPVGYSTSTGVYTFQNMIFY